MTGIVQLSDNAENVSQFGLLQTDHSRANAEVLLGVRTHRQWLSRQLNYRDEVCERKVIAS